MLAFKKAIPHLITLLNLLCGSLSVVSALKGNTEAAGIFILFASVFDFFDGFAARLLHCKSELGKQLDSLADIVSFGLAPAVIMFQLMTFSDNLPHAQVYNVNPLTYVAFLIVLFSALRLAKFNIDERQTDSFIGLPTPANALLIASLPLILWVYSASNCTTAIWARQIIGNYYFLAVLTFVFSYLLISELPLISLKFKTYALKENTVRYLFLLISVVLIVFFHIIALPFIIIIYIILSVIFNLTILKNKL